MHKPIKIQEFSLSFSHKVCFTDFSTQISYGSRIAIIGRNGCGKTSLLTMLKSISDLTEGVQVGYVPQIIHDRETLSGGQRFNAAFTKALSSHPNVLLLDEPTNHLDRHNRKSLFRLLQSFPGTLIVVSHDTELLRGCTNTLWHIDNGQIHIFSGNYEDYKRERNTRRLSLEEKVLRLNQEKKTLHQALMKEQSRASKSKTRGEKSITHKKWPTIVSKAKAGRAEETSGKKKANLDHQKQEITEKLLKFQAPEIILPTFSLNAEIMSDRIILSIQDGTIGYQRHNPILKNINLSLSSKGRLAMRGHNGSGKTTLVRAILQTTLIERMGSWFLPKKQDIGYLDQHYGTLTPHMTALESLAEIVPSWSHNTLRTHLNNFLFRKNEEVNTLIKNLSGGEKARLSLAHIALKTPKLLILDEITNNMDLETKDHMIQILRKYPGALIIISHDTDFLSEIGMTDSYDTGEIRKNK